MKNLRKMIALLLALMLAVSGAAFAEKKTVSDAFRLPGVSEKPAAEEPAEEPAVEEPADEPVVEQPAEEEAADEEQTEVEEEKPLTVIGSVTVTMKDASSRLNVRAEASQSSAVLGRVENGAVLSAYADEGGWIKVAYNGGVGFVSADLVTWGVVEETPAEETPAEETPAEETPAEETPAEETPAEETPAEETPAEEIPAEEDVTEEETEVGQEAAPSAIGKVTVALKDASSNLNVRAEAGQSSAVLGSVAHGTVLTAYADEGEWIMVSYNGGFGYVKADHITWGAVEEAPAEEPTEEIPTEEIPAEETVEYLTDENGELILDENGNPIPVEPAEEPVEETPAEEIPAEEIPAEETPAEETVEYLTDENGELILDENGNPIPVTSVEEEPAVETPAEEETVEYLLDAEGNPVLDLNGNPIPAGNYQLDEEGNLIFDENGCPIPVVEEEEIVEEEPSFEVNIFPVDPKEVYYLGDIFRFQSEIIGECAEPVYQWQVLDSANPDQGWVDIAGATGASYEFSITEANFYDSYRVVVEDAAEPVAVEEPVEATEAAE